MLAKVDKQQKCSTTSGELNTNFMLQPSYRKIVTKLAHFRTLMALLVSKTNRKR